MGVYKPKKQLGQNFLKDKSVLGNFLKVVEEASFGSPSARPRRSTVRPFAEDYLHDASFEDSNIIEIGAGQGVITKELVKQAQKVVAFELDGELVEKYLKPLTQEYPNLEIRNEDILNFQFSVLNFQPTLLCGAIPYQITSPLLHKLVYGFWENPVPAVFILQYEVAEKVVARPPKASYLSNLVELYGKAEILGEKIPPTAFWPAPKVDSAILKITPWQDLEDNSLGSPSARPNTGTQRLPTENHRRRFHSQDIRKFSRFLHRGFKNPRKMLNKAFDKIALEEVSIDPTLRPQNLSLEDWLNLFAKISISSNSKVQIPKK